VIGGGDWAEDRIITDCITALTEGQTISIRNPLATRPWQHVLEPLSGYMWLAHQLRIGPEVTQGWNFGPDQHNVRNVQQLVDQLVRDWGSGAADHLDEAGAPREAAALSLNIDKACSELAWKPVWDFERTIAETVGWYKAWSQGRQDLRQFTQDQIDTYMRDAAAASIAWAVTHES